MSNASQVRFSALSERSPGRELRPPAEDGLVDRRVFAEVPARVEYSLTPLGWTIAEPLMALAEWGDAHGDDVAGARTRYLATSSPDVGTSVRPAA